MHYISNYYAYFIYDNFFQKRGVENQLSCHNFFMKLGGLLDQDVLFVLNLEEWLLHRLQRGLPQNLDVFWVKRLDMALDLILSAARSPSSSIIPMACSCEKQCPTRCCPSTVL